MNSLTPAQRKAKQIAIDSISLRIRELKKVIAPKLENIANGDRRSSHYNHRSPLEQYDVTSLLCHITWITKTRKIYHERTETFANEIQWRYAWHSPSVYIIMISKDFHGITRAVPIEDFSTTALRRIERDLGLADILYYKMRGFTGRGRIDI